jgi:hypothetical protein
MAPPWLTGLRCMHVTPLLCKSGKRERESKKKLTALYYMHFEAATDHRHIWVSFVPVVGF